MEHRKERGGNWEEKNVAHEQIKKGEKKEEDEKHSIEGPPKEEDHLKKENN